MERILRGIYETFVHGDTESDIGFVLLLITTFAIPLLTVLTVGKILDIFFG